VDLSDQPATLHIRQGLLLVQREGHEDVTIPVGDIAAVVASHGRVMVTQAVLAELAMAGASFVACDSRHMPVAMLLPLDAHHVQAERMALQMKAPLPTRKRLWQQLVRAKIDAQAGVLSRITGRDHGLPLLKGQVRSGDPTNVEARAARRYWTALFGKDFRRDQEQEDHNRHLNYGYAVLRAVTARAICGAGLHPTIGLHHKNRYNSFALADDLMEPFRPIVDEAVHRFVGAHGADAPLDTTAKQALLGALLGKGQSEGELRTLFDLLARLAWSLVAVLEGRRGDLLIHESWIADT
jgi:CRISPR-associated protein Cas1